LHEPPHWSGLAGLHHQVNVIGKEGVREDLTAGLGFDGFQKLQVSAIIALGKKDRALEAYKQLHRLNRAMAEQSCNLIGPAGR
jgi:hypothetical protein